MAEDDKPHTTDSDPPPDSRCTDTPAPGAPLTNEAAVSPAGGAPNAADAIRDIGEAIAARRWAAPCSALEEIAQRLSKQEAAWRQAVASIMAPPVFPHETVALLQRLREPPVILPDVAKNILEAQAILRGDQIARRFGESQGALMAEMAGCLSSAMMPAGKPWPELQMSSTIERAYRKAAEEHRRMTEWLRSSAFEREMAAVARTTRLLKEVVESSMPRWLEATSAVSSLQDLAAQVVTGLPPWPGDYSSGPSLLFPAAADSPDDDASATPPEVEPPPMVMPARPSWRAHPGRRRSYARAIERRDRKAAGVLPAGVSAEQWDLLVSIARERGCPVTQVLQELFDLLTGAPFLDRQRQVWALGKREASRENPAPSADAQRILIRDRGGVFRVSFGGVSCEFRKTKGFHILKCLTDNPLKQYWAGELWAAASGRGAVATRDQTQGYQDSGACAQEVGPASPRDVGAMELADRKAIRAFKKRVKQLDGLIAEAHERGDFAAIDALTKEKALTLAEMPIKEGGKGSRYEHSELEKRVRKNVGNLVRIALRSLEREFPAAEAEIRAHLKLGYRCTYGGPLS